MKVLSSGARLVACATLAWAASAVQAETYNLAISGAYTASWQMDSSPTPNIAAGDSFFEIWNVSGNFPGSSDNVVSLSYNGSEDGSSGGLSIRSGSTYLFDAQGAQLYTGSGYSPTLKLGSFAMTQYNGTDTYTLTVSAVPEPASLALMLGGLGLVGWTVSRRRR